MPEITVTVIADPLTDKTTARLQLAGGEEVTEPMLASMLATVINLCAVNAQKIDHDGDRGGQFLNQVWMLAMRNQPAQMISFLKTRMSDDEQSQPDSGPRDEGGGPRCP